MFLSRFLFSRTPVFGGLVVAGLLWMVQPASAQQPIGAVSKFDRANAGAALSGTGYTPWYVQRAPIATTQAVLPRPAAGSLVVTVKAPVRAEPVYVTLRGPDGEVQRYALEGGLESIQTRTVIVRQGEKASFRFAVATPPKGPELR